MKQQQHATDDDYRPNFALGVVVLTAVILAGVVIGLSAVWGI